MDPLIILILIPVVCLVYFLIWGSDRVIRSEHEYEIRAVPRESDVYPYEVEVYRDGQRLNVSRYYRVADTKQQAIRLGYLARKADIQAQKRHRKLNLEVEDRVVIPAKRSRAKKAVVKSTDYTRLKDRFAKNELTQEEFEREIGKLLIEEEKKETA